MDSLDAITKFELINAAVEFIDVKDEYDMSKDLVCKYKVEGYEVQEGDKIAVFKVGWCHIKDCVMLENVSMAKNCNHFYVIFERSKLPKDESELYQFCYISSKNELYGASSTFKIIATADQRSSKLFEKLYQSEYNETTVTRLDAAIECQKLKDENLNLKKTLKLLVDKHLDDPMKEGDNEILMLRKSVDSLKTFVSSQSMEIKLLKRKIDIVEQEHKELFLENNSLKMQFDSLKKLLSHSTKIFSEKLKDQIQFQEDSHKQNSSTFDLVFLDNIPELPPFPISRPDS